MKLKVRQTGVVEKELDVNIRNPTATLSNVRAAISILFKLEPHSFRMVHESAVLDDDKVLLSSTGVRDGDLVTLVAKRAREDEEGAGVQAASSSAATASGGAPPNATVASASASSVSEERLTVPAPRAANAAKKHSRRATAGSRPTVPHPLADDDEDPFLAQRIEADEREEAEGNNSEEDEEDEIASDDDGDDGQNSELGEMVSALLSVPNILDLRQEFLENPQRVLAQIQQTNPRLFHLISTHNQEFLEMVQNETLLHALQEEQEMTEAFIGNEEDEELDSDEEAEIHQMLLAAMGADAAEGHLGDADDHDEDDAGGDSDRVGSAATLGRNATQILESFRNSAASRAASSRRVGHEAASTDASSAATANTGSCVASSARTGMNVPSVIPEEDSQKIESLMQLGFTREQCTSAFYRCSRSIERAANLLFEGMPSP